MPDGPEDLIQKQLADGAKKMDALTSPSPEEIRILNYFWKNRVGKFVESVPVEAICYFEFLRSPALEQSQTYNFTQAKLWGLQSKGLLERKPIALFVRNGLNAKPIDCMSLTRKGSEEIFKRHFHPTIWWGRMLYSLPDWFTLAYTVFMTALAIASFVIAFPQVQKWIEAHF